MKQSLSAAGYSQSGEGQLWRREGYGVSDSAENEALCKDLLDVLQLSTDLRIFSPVLAEACVNPFRRLNLSSERANILRPFEDHFHPNTRVLEIGAGCGAITRFLGESGAQVVGLEACIGRAEVARERTRDLPNVEIVADRLQDYPSGVLFDVIVLVGALEYAPKYSFAENPGLEMLRKAKALLSQNGQLILATANQLGLKYLAGVPEDTLGLAMAGIEERFGSGLSRTYGRLELISLLEKAGFKGHQFFAPLPDFKMPSTIISEKGTNSTADNFDVGVLAAQAVRRDPQLTHTTFNIQLAWPEIVANGLILELGNSILVKTCTEVSTQAQSENLAFHYSTQRVSKFTRQTVFTEKEGEGIQVHSRALFTEGAKSTDTVRLHIQSDEPYYQGTLLSANFREILGTPGWKLEDLAALVRTHVDTLTTLLENGSEKNALDSFDAVLPDNFLDATPGNLIIQRNGVPACFDLEWKVDHPTLGWVLWRSLLFMLGGTLIAPMASQHSLSLGELINKVLGNVLDSPLSVGVWLERELEFQHAVTGKDQQQAISAMLDTMVVT